MTPTGARRCRKSTGADLAQIHLLGDLDNHERPNMALGGITPAMKLAMAA